MTNRTDWPNVAVVGAGAVGGYFGAMLARAGAPVVMIGRKAFVDAVQREGIFIDGVQFAGHVPVQASTEASACKQADLVLIAVKTFDSESTARALAPFLKRDAIILTLQNGADGAQQIRAITRRETYAAVVYVAAAITAPGHVRHFGRGDLVLGPGDTRVRWIAQVCESADIPCRLTENIEGERWLKLLMNCALNAISALAQVSYASIGISSDARTLLEITVTEVLNVARAARIELPGLQDSTDAMDGVMRLVGQMPDQLSSTAQDVARRRPTEIASLNGYVCRRGAELGIPTPANQALFALVRLLEDKNLALEQ